MIYCRVNAKSVTTNKKDKPKFTTTAPKKVEKEKATKTRTKRVEETETKE